MRGPSDHSGISAPWRGKAAEDCAAWLSSREAALLAVAGGVGVQSGKGSTVRSLLPKSRG